MIWLEDLSQRIAIENADTGRLTRFDIEFYAAPCEEFGYIAPRSQHKQLPAVKLKSTLQLLGKGRRGLLLVLSDGQELAILRSGDKVFMVSAGQTRGQGTKCA